MISTDPTDPAASGPASKQIVLKSTTAYNSPGMPTPPAGWGKVLGYGEAQMERDEGESSPDTDEGMS